jgi:TRAP-type transport system periplasmic protein
MIGRRQMIAGLASIGLGVPRAALADASWDMPTPYTDGTFHTQNIRWFVDEVARSTSNGLRIQVHSNNALIRGPEILRAVSTGQVPAGEILISQFGNEEPVFELDAIPFLTANRDQARSLYDVSKAAVEAALRRRGVRMLYCVIWPSQAFFSKTPINSAADMRGMKFRTGSPMTSRMAELLGAVPTVVQGSEIPQAFATNIVTGMVTSGATGVQSRAWEFSTDFINLRAFMPKNAVIVNERAWQRLPEPVRTAITGKAAEAEERGWELAVKAEADSVEELRKNGMTIVEPSPALLTDVRNVGNKLAEEWTVKTGELGKQLIDAYRAKVRA